VDRRFIPYGRQTIDDDDIKEVVEVLNSDWLTTGPKIAEFEESLAQFVGARYAVAVSSGTAALHCAMFALEIGPGDEVIVPPMTFAATANCVVYQGGTPVFADVDPETLLIDPDQVESKITPKTKAIIGVDYAGQPCDWDALREIADRHHLALVADSCHALGAEYKGRKIGTLADLTVFSFHPVKHITTGEGGMITTNDPALAERIRRFRNHGINIDHQRRDEQGAHFYEMVSLGYNYRLTDLQSALGLSQLEKLPEFVRKRQTIAGLYTQAFASVREVSPISVRSDVSHAYHLYVIQMHLEQLKATREQLFSALRREGILANVHYIPVHLHPYYRQQLGTAFGMCPVAEKAYERILTLPLFPAMSTGDVERVISVVKRIVEANRAPASETASSEDYSEKNKNG